LRNPGCATLTPGGRVFSAGCAPVLRRAGQTRLQA
jgi:hypothetical protein